MWSVVRSTAARQLRASQGVKQVNSSRIANSFVIPSAYRLVIAQRSFTETGGELAAKSAETTASPKAKKASTTATAAKKKPAAKKVAAAEGKEPKAKKAEKKAAPKKLVKKVLTPEERAKVEIRELKKAALLKEPKRLPDKTWLVYCAEHLTGKENVTGIIKGLAEEYKNLSASEMERLETVAGQNRLANHAAYKVWVESHTPVEIDAANHSRRRLRRISETFKKTEIKDDRLPTKPLSSYAKFAVSRWQSGDLSGPLVDISSKIAQEWRSLSASEREQFEASSRADRERYKSEVQSTLHRTVGVRRPSA